MTIHSTRLGISTIAAARRLLLAWLLLAVLGSLVQRAVAQERWLLVFDTSQAMKKRLPAMDVALKKLLGSSMGENMNSGDSVGVWTFDSHIHTGDYPLFTWQPEQAMLTATNLMKFIRKQEFKGETDFNALEPLIDRVIQHSQRLTVAIFCDGDGQVNWTPYDDGINENLQQGLAERQKHRQPVIMIVRTQEGHFIGATVNYPPLPPTFTPFPPLASATKPAPPPPQPPPPPVVTLPPLVIVGTTAGTDITATARFIATNKPARMEVVHTNLAPTNAGASLPPATTEVADVSTSPPAASVSATVKMANKTASTNSAVAGTTDEGSDNGTRILLVLGAILFGVALLLVLWLALRPRRPQNSLISTLMAEDPKYRK
jgi:hypothetical protein